ncbi:2433_t:CDS:2 [Paraglomus occultum]|uniref:GTP-binding protein n=1 Tax=Paraglomus occultum TaxID=144539 RepID=A0A9N9BCP0_9GLOM|nr:2433_t:CDS:2 [Paraglomus occultum]
MSVSYSSSDGDEFSLHTATNVDHGPTDELPDDDSFQDHRPRLLIMGLRRSGKSSIRRVVFHKLPANETLYLRSTQRLEKDNITSFVNFQVWDFPGQEFPFNPVFDVQEIFGEYGALIFVIDAQDDYGEALARLHEIMIHAYRINSELAFEVFIHKVDALSDDYKLDTQRNIHQRTMDALSDAELEIEPRFHLTSIYDHSIFEAFSKVIQKLIPQLPTLENLLNSLCATSGIDKAFLFDVNSKIYIATDRAPVDMQTYEICSDMIDVIMDVSEIYRPVNEDAQNIGGAAGAAESTNSSVMMDRADDTAATIQLTNGVVLALKGVNRFLALVCILRAENYGKHGLLEYNFQCFKQAIAEVFEVKRMSTERLKQENLRMVAEASTAQV